MNIYTVINSLFELLNDVAVIIVTLAVIGFMWGVVKIIFNHDSKEIKQEGRKFMLYGIITLFVMTSAWGLVYILKNSITL